MLYDALNPKGTRFPIENIYYLPLINYEEYVVNEFNTKQDIILGGFYFDSIYKVCPFILRASKEKTDKLNNYNALNLSNNGILKLNLFEKIINMSSSLDSRILFNNPSFFSNMKIGIDKLLTKIYRDSYTLNKPNGIEEYINSLNKPLNYEEFMSVNNSLFILNASIIYHYDTIAKVLNAKKNTYLSERQRSLKKIVSVAGNYNTEVYQYRNTLLIKAKEIFESKNIFDNETFNKLKENLKKKYDISYVTIEGEEL